MEKAYEAAYSYQRMATLEDYKNIIKELPMGKPNLPKKEEPEQGSRDSKNPLESKT